MCALNETISFKQHQQQQIRDRNDTFFFPFLQYISMLPAAVATAAAAHKQFEFKHFFFRFFQFIVCFNNIVHCSLFMCRLSIASQILNSKLLTLECPIIISILLFVSGLTNINTE